MITDHNQGWVTLYTAALLDVDWQTLPGRIVLAKQSILDRLKTLRSSSNHHEERQDLADATNNIRFLEMEIRRNLGASCGGRTRSLETFGQ